MSAKAWGEQGEGGRGDYSAALLGALLVAVALVFVGLLVTLPRVLDAPLPVDATALCYQANAWEDGSVDAEAVTACLGRWRAPREGG